MDDERVLQVHPLPLRLRHLLPAPADVSRNRSAGGSCDTEVAVVAAHIIRIGVDPIEPFAEDDSFPVAARRHPIVSRFSAMTQQHSLSSVLSSQQIIQKAWDNSSSSKVVELAVFLDQATYTNFMNYFEQDTRALMNLVLAYINGVIVPCYFCN